MHDRTSDKPPSTFMRIFKTSEPAGTGGGMEVDQLMEDYMADETAGSPEKKPAVAATVTNGMGVTHEHAGRSAISVSDTIRKAGGHGRTYSTDSKSEMKSIAGSGMDDAGRSPGMFRLSKTFASAFNPVNLWQKMTKSWGDAKDEMHKKETEEPKNDPFEARRLAYEAKYQELKKAGLLGQLGSNNISGSHIFSEGYSKPAPTKPVAEHGPRYDSGVELTDSTRPSVESSTISGHSVTSSNGTQGSGTIRARTISFFRTPSLGNLRKSKSTANLHPPKTPTAESPEKTDGEHTLRRSQSRKDLAKQQKLTKRVSDLESKLNEARRELRQVLGDEPGAVVPPVPALPRNLAHFGSIKGPSFSARAAQKKSHSRNPSRMPFSPELPSLPSERLLDPEMLKEASRGMHNGNEALDNASDSVMKDIQSDATTPVRNPKRLSGQLTPEEKILASTELIDVPRMPDRNASLPPHENGQDGERMSCDSSSAAPPPPPAGILKKTSGDRKTAKKRKSVAKMDRSYKSGSASDSEEYTSKTKAATIAAPRRKRFSRAIGLGGSSDADGLPSRPHSLYDLGRNGSKYDISLMAAEAKVLQGLEILDEDTPLMTTPVEAAAPSASSSDMARHSRTSSRNKSNKITVPVATPSLGPLQFPDEGGIVLKATPAPSSVPPSPPHNRVKTLKRDAAGKLPRESFEWPDDVF